MPEVYQYGLNEFFYDEGRKTQALLRKILPAGLQLKYPVDREEKLGVPVEELLKLRYSKDPEDQYFFKRLLLETKRRSGEDISQEEEKELQNLEYSRKEKLFKVIDSVENYILVKEAIQKLPERGYNSDAAEIALALGEYAMAREVMQKLLERGYESKAAEIALALGEYAMAREVMQKLLERGYNYDATQIALALLEKDPNTAREVMQKLLERGYNYNATYNATKIALALVEKDPNTAIEATQKLLEKEYRDEATQIALSLAEKDPNAAREAMQKLLERGYNSAAAKIALAVAEKDPNAAREAMQKLLERGYNSDATQIALAVAEKDPNAAREAMQKLLEERYNSDAAKIALAVAEKAPNAAREVMQKLLERGYNSDAAKIALALGEYATAREVMQKLLERGYNSAAAKIALALGEYATAREALQRLLEERYNSDAAKIALVLAEKDPNAAREAMQRLLKRGYNSDAAQIALALGEYATAREAMQRLLEEDYNYNATQIALALVEKDPNATREAMQKLLEKGHRDEATQIALALLEKDPNAAREAMQRLLEEGYNSEATKIALSLAEKDPNAAREAMQRLLEEGYESDATQIALALVEKDPNTAREVMQKLLEEGHRDEATQIALALVEKDPDAAREAVQKLLERGYDYDATQIALALVEKDPDAAREAMQKLLKEGYNSKAAEIALALGEYATAREALRKLLERGYNYSEATQIALAVVKQIPEQVLYPLLYFQEVLLTHQVQSEELSFSYIRIAGLLREGRDLGTLIVKDIPSFRAIKEYSLKINSLLTADKQTPNVEVFWQNNQERLARLFNISSELTKNLINSKLSQFGFPRLQRILELADSFSLDFEANLNLLIEKTKTTEIATFEKLLELYDAYLRMNLKTALSQQIENLLSKSPLTPQEAVAALSKELFLQFSRKLGIQAEISDETLSQWNLEYLSKLFFAERNFQEESKEALRLIIKSALQGDFEKIILREPFDSSRYSREELEMIQEIQHHNQQVETEFQRVGLDYHFWLRGKPIREFSVGVSEVEKQQAIENFLKELSEIFFNILGRRRENIPGILPADRGKALFNKVFKKYGLGFNENGQLTFFKGKGEINPLDIKPALQETIDFLQSELESIVDERQRADLSTALDHLRNISDALPKLHETLKQKGYLLQIKPWERQPGYDIFQGNYTHCCIAVENFNQAAILDYLTDTGINVIEIKDKNTDQTIAQSFIFMAQNPEGQNILVLDNVEINNNYRGLHQTIRQHLFEYIKEYAERLAIKPEKKINTILLGTAYNDVDTSGLPYRDITLFKIGGGGVAGRQYLDSFDSSWVDPSRPTTKTFYVVLDLLKPSETRREVSQFELLTQLDDATLEQILSVEQASFPAAMQSTKEDLRETLENPNGIQIILRAADGTIVGYLASKPHNEALEELRQYDPKMQEEENALYIESIAILPESRSLRTFLQLGRTLLQEVKNRGFKKITMHARVASGLSSALQKRCGAKHLRTIDNWYNFGEPFDYLEIEV